MARASTECVCVVAREAHSPPPCARCSPGGAVIAYVRCRWEVAEAVSMSSVLLTHRRAALALRRGRPLAPLPPRALVFPLALLSRSIAADTGSMAPVSRLFAAVAKEEWQ